MSEIGECLERRSDEIQILRNRVADLESMNAIFRDALQRIVNRDVPGLSPGYRWAASTARLALSKDLPG